MSFTAADIEARTEQLLPEMAALVVRALNLPLAPADVNPDAPLYGGELGLDSIDILEIALEVSKKYKIQLKADDKNNAAIFASLRTLARYVIEQQARN
jgi:acyl carrier protein